MPPLFLFHFSPLSLKVSRMAYGWEGEKVRLVPLEKERHAANVQAWVNDPDLTETILSGDLPTTRVSEDDWFDKMCAPLGQHPAEIVFAI